MIWKTPLIERLVSIFNISNELDNNHRTDETMLSCYKYFTYFI